MNPQFHPGDLVRHKLHQIEYMVATGNVVFIVHENVVTIRGMQREINSLNIKLDIFYGVQ